MHWQLVISFTEILEFNIYLIIKLFSTMKQFYQIALVVVLTITASFAHANFLLDNDSVSMGASYANDVFYSFENGDISSVERTNWDIGFYTLTWSAGIIINDGNAVELKLYPLADTSGWETIDTTGLSTWPFLNNSTEDWEEGAFNRSATGHPDYGWGVYNTVNHNVIGDSIYILKTGDGLYKKLWIESKMSSDNIYHIRYANLDGSDEIEMELNCNDYLNKNFVYYSFSEETILDREPNNDSWDILFTKYNVILENGSPYIVTGVLNNIDVSGNRFDMVGHDYSDWSAMTMDTARETVGYDWKSFDFATGWMVFDSVVFFVMDINGNVNKLRFTGFEGMSSGKIFFEKSLASPASVFNISYDAELLLFPNPASDFIQVDLPTEINWEMLTITDLSGKLIYTHDGSLNGVVTIPVEKLNPGVYLVTTKSAEKIAVQKLIIQ